MRVAISPNAAYRQGHAEAVLNQIGVPAMYREGNKIITIMSEHQYELWSRLAGPHGLEILDETKPLPTQPAPVTDFVMQQVPGEPIHVRLERERIVRERVFAANLPMEPGSPHTPGGVIPPAASTPGPEPEPEAEDEPAPEDPATVDTKTTEATN